MNQCNKITITFDSFLSSYIQLWIIIDVVTRTNVGQLLVHYLTFERYLTLGLGNFEKSIGLISKKHRDPQRNTRRYEVRL